MKTFEDLIKLIQTMTKDGWKHNRRKDFYLDNVTDLGAALNLVKEATEVLESTIGPDGYDKILDELADTLGVLLHMVCMQTTEPEKIANRCYELLLQNFHYPKTKEFLEKGA